jgi:hypothetical protein
MDCAYLMEIPTYERQDHVHVLNRPTIEVSDGIATQFTAARDRAYEKRSTHSKTTTGTRREIHVVWPHKGQRSR